MTVDRRTLLAAGASVLCGGAQTAYGREPVKQKSPPGAANNTGKLSPTTACDFSRSFLTFVAKGETNYARIAI